MFRKIFCVQVCLLLFSSNQTACGGGRDSTGMMPQQKVLIIPYEPEMHISDADLDISEYSDKTPQQVRTILRSSIIETLNAKLQVNYQTHSLLQDLRPEARQEMTRIYASLNYSYDTSFAILHPKPDSTALKGKWNENKARKKELEKRTASGDVRYMNVTVADPNLLKSLKQKYGADLFVFLTQIEIKTNAKDCSDLQSQHYGRDIKIHYSVYNAEGEQVYGDVASVRFPSNSNEVEVIVDKNFPVIGDMINKAITQK
jgi:hypothetical protein